MQRRDSWRTNLGVFSSNAVENSPVRALRVAALLPRFWIIFISLSKALRTKVVSVAKRLVDALQRFVAGHEDLESISLSREGPPRSDNNTYPFKGRRARPRVSGYKDGFAGHLDVLSKDGDSSVRDLYSKYPRNSSSTNRVAEKKKRMN